MKNWNELQHPIARRLLHGSCAAALAVTLSLSGAVLAQADPVTPPPVPDKLQVDANNRAFLVGHGVGTQNYICLPCPNPTTPGAMCPDTSGFAWLLFTPEATLFSDQDRQLTTHFFSPTPTSTGRSVPRGRTRGTRARSGPRRSSPLLMPPLSRWMPSPGSSFRWSEPKATRRAAAR